MSLTSIKVNNSQIISIDDKPIINSNELIKSGGIYQKDYNTFNIQEEWIDMSTVESITHSSESIEENWSGILYGSWHTSSNRNINSRYGYEPTGEGKFSTYLYKFTERSTTLCVRNIDGGNEYYRAYAIFDANDELVFERKNQPKDSNVLLLRCPVGYSVLISTKNPNGKRDNCFTAPVISYITSQSLKDILFSYPEELITPYEVRSGYYLNPSGVISGGGIFPSYELLLYYVQTGSKYRLVGTDSGAISVAKSFTDSSLETGVEVYLSHNENTSFNVDSIIEIGQTATVLVVCRHQKYTMDAYLLGNVQNINNLDKLQSEIDTVEKYIKINKESLVRHNGFITLNGGINQQEEDTYFYTDPIKVNKGDVFELSSYENAAIPPISFWVDDHLSSLIELISNPINGGSIRRFICWCDGYLVFSGEKSFFASNSFYLKKGTDNTLAAYNFGTDIKIDDFTLGKIASSLLYRKSLDPSLLLTSIAGYISNNGIINTWSATYGVFVFDISSYAGKLMNITKITNVVSGNTVFAFYSSTETFGASTYIPLDTTIIRNTQGSFLLRIPANAKAFGYYGLTFGYNYTEEELREYFTLIAEKNEEGTYPLYDIFGIESYKQKVDELYRSNKIICWGDSLTAAGAGNVPYAERWPSRLANNLPSSKYSVINCGVGGEGIASIMARNGAAPAVAEADFTLPANTDYVNVGSRLVNYYGDPVMLLLQGEGESVNPIYIKGVACTLNQTTIDDSRVYRIKRNTAAESTMVVKAGVPFATKGSMQYREPYCAIIWMGTNNSGSITLEEYVSTHEQILEYTGTDKYIIIGLHIDTVVTRGVYQDFEETFEKKYGLRFINWRKYLVERGWIDAGYTLSAADQQRVANHLVPSVMLVDSVHLTAESQRLLYNLVIERMVGLGYIKLDEAIYD